VKKKDKWESYDINKQTIYIVPKSKERMKGALRPGACMRPYVTECWSKRTKNMILSTSRRRSSMSVAS